MNESKSYRGSCLFWAVFIGFYHPASYLRSRYSTTHGATSSCRAAKLFWISF